MPATTTAKLTGVVKWFDDAKGYGFIAPDGGGDELFVHQTAIIMPDRKARRTLTDGQRVQYEPGQGKKGPAAMKVVPLDAMN